MHWQAIGVNGIPTMAFSEEGIIPLSAKHHHVPEYDPFAPPRISIPPYSTSTWDTDVDLVDVRHLISDAYRQQWDKGNRVVDDVINQQFILPIYKPTVYITHHILTYYLFHDVM